MKTLQCIFGGLAVAVITLFSSCSDDDIVAEVTLPAEIEQAQTQGLESHSYSIPFEVKSDSEWEIEFDEAGEEIAYVHPSSGKGNATIKLYVLDNLSKEPRQGTMTIVFQEDTEKNKVVTLKQKSQGAMDDNFNKESVGNIVYGVGYGFNVVTGIGPRGLKAQIVKAQLLTEQNYVQKAATSSTMAQINTYTGSTVKDLSNNFSSNFNLNGSGFGIEAEANAKFDINHYSKDEYQYAMTFVDISKEQITITLSPDEWAYFDNVDGGCMTKAAYKAINGEHRKYPSTNAGFKALFDSYGTHVVRTAGLGGRLTIATTVNTTDIGTEYNLDAFAKLSYKGIIDTSADVKDELKNSFKENSNAIQTKITALGGTSSVFNDLNDLVGDGAKTAYQTWLSSLNEDESTWTFIGLDHVDNLVPIWDLVEDGDRAKQMQEYFESGQYEKDATVGITYDLGLQAELDELPVFDVTGTQVADVKVGANQDKTVARIYNEFIPALDEKGPVKVIYPVVNGNVKWSLGWFPGNSYSVPCRVVNANGEVKIENIPSETKVGEATEIYIRGVHISSQALDDEIPVQSASSAFYYDQLYRGEKMSDYKVVKILDKIWLAENYAGTVLSDGKYPQLADYAATITYESPVEGVNDWCYYSQDFFRLYKKYPGKWSDVFRPVGEGGYEIINHIVEKLLKPYNIDVANAFSVGGCLRFNAPPSGHMISVKSSGSFVLSMKTGTENNFYLLYNGDIKNGRDINYEVFNINFDTGNCGQMRVKTWDSSLVGNSNETRVMTPLRLYRALD